MAFEIWIVPFFGQGHLFPCMELCKHIASRNFKATLVISSNIASSLPSTLREYHLVQIAEIPSSPMPPTESKSQPLHPIHNHHNQVAQGLEKLLSQGTNDPNGSRPVCAILDVMMSWSQESFNKFQIPTVAMFTSGACSAALEYATWKARTEDMKPGEIRLLPGLPEEMALTYSDLKRRPHGPPPPPSPGGLLPPFEGAPPPPLAGGPPPFGGAGFPAPPGGPGKMGPPKLGDEPRWLEETRGTIALMINTCDDLERPFIDYIANQIRKPVWRVGPLLPEKYWKSAGSILHDRKIRTSRRSNVTEDEVLQWLDSKPCGSVLYVSFGSLVGPTTGENSQIAEALESSTHPFIWVIQPNAGRPGPLRPFLGEKSDSGGPEEEEGYFPHGMDSRVGKRGLIIRGWAPQLLILSHQSTGGFLSHCGWNSTVEGIGRGVPFLAWPIGGDQYYDAKLLVNHLKVGYMVSDDLSQQVKKDDIGKGIEKLMNDKEMKKRAENLSAKFQHGFPSSSVAALDAFRDFVNGRLG